MCIEKSDANGNDTDNDNQLRDQDIDNWLRWCNISFIFSMALKLYVGE